MKFRLFHAENEVGANSNENNDKRFIFFIHVILFDDLLVSVLFLFSSILFLPPLSFRLSFVFESQSTSLLLSFFSFLLSVCVEFSL